MDNTIHERSQNIQASISHNPAFYEQLIKKMPVAMYCTDAEGNLTLFNDAVAKLWGRQPVIGNDRWCGAVKLWLLDGSPMQFDKHPTVMGISQSRSVRAYDMIVERPDGTKRQVASYCDPVFDESGKLSGTINTLMDVSDLTGLARELEARSEDSERDLHIKTEELQKSEERYQKMTEEVEDYAILLLDENGFIQNWNRGAQKIKGYTEAEVVGKHFRIFYPKTDQEDKLPEKLIALAVDSGKALHEGWRIRKDGTYFWGSVTITALHDTANNVIGFSKVTRDLTDKKLTDDKIKQYASDLEFQNKELQQFAYAAAHDMKEPIRKIQFYNSYIFDNGSEQLPEKSRDYLKKSIASASRMQTLIDDLLTYSKASSMSGDHEKVDLSPVLSEVLLTYNDTLQEIGAKVEYDPLPVINGVRVQLHQLLDNLIGNAIKYRDPQRQLVIKIRSGKVAGNTVDILNADKRQIFYTITVSDNGTGFDHVDASKIFDLFQRLHNRSYSGTGIGLALCKKIVQNHKGQILATGTPGEGASFTCYLPVS